MAEVLDQLKVLAEEVKKSQVPPELQETVVIRLEQLAGLVESPTFLPEFDSIRKYIDWITHLPWEARTEDVLDINRAKEVLDKSHHGLNEIKDRVLEYMSIMKLNVEKGSREQMRRAPILCFVGLVGTGKTTIANSIAEAMGRKFARIPFGGMGDPLDLRGLSRFHSEAEPGKIIKALRTAGSRNPVILFDEIDRVTDQGRSSIMGVLVELLDPEQNKAFVDHYIDYPVNLSEVLFVATANNTQGISTAVMDRLEPIRMPSYSDEEKIIIGKRYMLPKILKQAGMDSEKIDIQDSVWQNITRPLGYDGGMRTLERTIEGVVRKVALQMVQGKDEKFVITSENVKQYLPH